MRNNKCPKTGKQSFYGDDTYMEGVILDMEARNGHSMSWYVCEHCGYKHLTSAGASKERGYIRHEDREDGGPVWSSVS